MCDKRLSRYRHVYPQRYSEDIHQKRDANVIFNEFYRGFVNKLTLRAKRLCRKYKVAPFVHEDCVQGAMMAVYRCIAKWEPSKGCLYTYTYRGQMKAMEVIIREFHANRPYSSKPIVRFIESEHDVEWDAANVGADISRAAQVETQLHDKIYLKRLFSAQMQRDPKRTTRFINYALDTNAISQLARENAFPITKQAYFNSVVYVRRQLRRKVRVQYA